MMQQEELDMYLYRILARCLDYPDGDLKENIEDIRQLARGNEGIREDECQKILNILDWIDQMDLIDLQQAYVNTFDMKPEHSLHLTHHLFGEDRERGPALVQLSETYKNSGLEIHDGELPDFLPAILEYVSTLDEVRARIFLEGTVEVLSELASKLEEATSPYAPLIRIIENRGQAATPAVH